MIEPKIDSANINPEWKGHVRASQGVAVGKRKKYKLLGGELVEQDIKTGVIKKYGADDKLGGSGSG